MVSVARTGRLVATAAGFTTAAVSGGPSVWAVAGLTAGALALLVVILFVPSEKPARRLSQLIQVWRSPTGRTARSGPPTRTAPRQTPSD